MCKPPMIEIMVKNMLKICKNQQKTVFFLWQNNHFVQNMKDTAVFVDKVFKSEAINIQVSAQSKGDFYFADSGKGQGTFEKSPLETLTH